MNTTTFDNVQHCVNLIKLNGIDGLLFGGRVITSKLTHNIPLEDWQRALGRLSIPNHRDTYIHRTIGGDNPGIQHRACVVVDMA